MIGGGEDFGQAFVRRLEGLSMHIQPKVVGWHERRIETCILLARYMPVIGHGFMAGNIAR